MIAFRFNTSYVNVYPIQSAAGYGVNSVSIHPMLMFILNIFKYFNLLIFVSIHPMLMFIQRISAISKNNYTNFSSIYQLFSIFYQPITHFIVFK